eukprot:2404148-Karenia_brevis.AAC.1
MDTCVAQMLCVCVCKVFGHFWGPEARAMQWLGVASKWRATSRAIGNCPSTASLATLAYNSRG